MNILIRFTLFVLITVFSSASESKSGCNACNGDGGTTGSITTNGGVPSGDSCNSIEVQNTESETSCHFDERNSPRPEKPGGFFWKAHPEKPGKWQRCLTTTKTTYTRTWHGPDKNTCDKDEEKEAEEEEADKETDEEDQGDCPGSGPPPPCGSNSPVKMKSGSWSYEEEDFSIGNPDWPIFLKRSYDSKYWFSGPFGNGWYDTLEAYLNPMMYVDVAQSTQWVFRTNQMKIILSAMDTPISGFDASWRGLSRPEFIMIPTPDNGLAVIRSVSDGANPLSGEGWEFNSSLQLVRKCNRKFECLLYSRDTSGKVTSITENISGFSIQIAYNQSHKISSIQDSFGRVWEYSYNTDGSLIQVKDPLQFTVKYKYEDARYPNAITEVINARDETYEEVVYQEDGRVQRLKEYGIWKDYEWDSFTVRSTDEYGLDKFTKFNQGGLATERSISGDATQIFYHNPPARNLIAGVVHPDGTVTAYDYEGGDLTLQKHLTHSFEVIRYSQNDPLVVGVPVEQEVNGETIIVGYDYQSPWMANDPSCAAEEGGFYEWPAVAMASRQIFQLYRDITDPRGCLYEKLSDLPGDSWTQEWTQIQGRSLLVRKTDPQGRATSYEYDLDGNRTAEIRPSGVIQRWQYNDDHRVIAELDGNFELIRQYTYSPTTGKVASITDSEGNLASFTYDARGNLSTQTSPNGAITNYEYSLLDQVTKIIHPENSSGIRGETLFTYDPAGNLLSKTDPEGRVTWYESDAWGRSTRETYSDGSFVQYEYEKDRLIKKTDEAGRETIYEFDSKGRQIQILLPNGSLLQKEYDSRDRVIAEIDAEGFSTQYVYNHLSQVLEIQFPDETHTLNIYDNSGLQTASLNEAGLETLYAWLGGELQSSITVIGTELSLTTSHIYDHRGQILTTTLPDQRQIHFGYDSINRLTRTTFADNSLLQSHFTSQSLNSGFTNELGRRFENVYDKRDLLVKRITPEGNEEHYEYDLSGLLSKVIYPAGNFKVFQRDLKAQITGEDHFDASGNLVNTVRWELSSTGAILKASSPDHTIFYSRDALDRVTMIDYADLNRRIFYSYNPRGLVTERAVLIPTTGQEWVESYTYDSRGRLSGIQTESGWFLIDWHEDGRRYQLTWPDGLVLEYQYDSLNRLNGLFWKRQNSTLYYQEYALDPSGRKTEITTPGGTSYIEYDLRGRVSRVDYPGGEWEAFAWDAASNLTEISGSFGLSLRTYDLDNRLLTDGTHLYSWDANGRLSQRSSYSSTPVTFGWDASNRLVSVHLPDSGQETYTYMPGKELRLTQALSSGNVIQTLWSGVQDIESTTSALNFGTTGVVFPSGWDERLIAASPDGSSSNLFSNELDSVIGGENGQNLSLTSYRAFGQNMGPAAPGPWGFTGRPLDETGFHYIRGRYYDSSSGIFLQQDPLRDGTNWLGYVAGDPFQVSDPSGFCKNDPYPHRTAPVGGGGGGGIDGGPETISRGGWGGGNGNNSKNQAGKNGSSATPSNSNPNGGAGTGKPSNPPPPACPSGQSSGNIHGNSKSSTNSNHRYVIVDTQTGNLHKTGISGGKLNQNGTSRRANTQVNQLNRQAGSNKYKSVVVENGLTRQQALRSEQNVVNTYYNRTGERLPGMQRPIPCLQ